MTRFVIYVRYFSHRSLNCSLIDSRYWVGRLIKGWPQLLHHGSSQPIYFYSFLPSSYYTQFQGWLLEIFHPVRRMEFPPAIDLVSTLQIQLGDSFQMDPRIIHKILIVNGSLKVWTIQEEKLNSNTESKTLQELIIYL